MKKLIAILLLAICAVSYSGYTEVVVEPPYNYITLRVIGDYVLTDTTYYNYIHILDGIVDITNANTQSLSLTNKAQVNIHGGNIFGIHIKSSSSNVTLYGKNYVVNGNHIYGNWSRSGDPFSIDFYPHNNFNVMDNVTLIPEPATCLFLLAGGLVLRKKKKI